jgi:hypothetical protein
MVSCSMRCQWGGSGGRAVMAGGMAAGMSMRLPVCSLVARVVATKSVLDP